MIHGASVTPNRDTDETRCTRCGFTTPGQLAWKGGECPSCTAAPPKKHNVVTRRNGERFTCRPWNGDFDELDRPTKGGELFRPGHRVCGRSDCVSPSHIVVEPELVAA